MHRSDFLERPGDLTLTVPWSEDLSQVKLRWSQDSSMNNGLYFSSLLVTGSSTIASVGSPGIGTLALSSVPEPSSCLLLGGLILVVTAARKTVEHGKRS
jgi:hypothetical protein